MTTRGGMLCARADAISSPASGAGPCGSNASSKRCSPRHCAAGVATGGPAWPDGRVARSLRDRSPTARMQRQRDRRRSSPTISYSISPLPITVAPVSSSPASTIEIIGMLLTGDSFLIVSGTGDARRARDDVERGVGAGGLDAMRRRSGRACAAGDRSRGCRRTPRTPRAAIRRRASPRSSPAPSTVSVARLRAIARWPSAAAAARARRAAPRAADRRRGARSPVTRASALVMRRSDAGGE